MGGYVSLVASEKFLPLGIFLLAPALYMNGYLRQDYKASVSNLEIAHGWGVMLSRLRILLSMVGWLNVGCI
jgi:hypothetical protein